MAKPTLSTDEKTQLTAQAIASSEQAATFTQNIANQAAAAAKLAISDGAFKKFFDYYNNIITPYDNERKSLDGQYQASPIVEADIVSVATLAGGRCQPGLPATDLVRIAEFDNTNLIHTIDSQADHITSQASWETNLATGSGQTYPGTLVTSTAVSSGSTTVGLANASVPISVVVGVIFSITDGTNSATMRITSITLLSIVPTYTATIGVEMIIAPASTITPSRVLSNFGGFTNTERNTKTASSPSQQPLLNYLISHLQSDVNGRISRMNDQLNAIAANTDPDVGSELTTETTKINTSKSFLTSYLISTDVSNTGLASLATERGVRSPQVTARVAQIISAYTTRTENYFNQRYVYANNRGSTSRGTLRLQKVAEQNGATSASYASSLTAQASAISTLLGSS